MLTCTDLYWLVYWLVLTCTDLYWLVLFAISHLPRVDLLFLLIGRNYKNVQMELFFIHQRFGYVFFQGIKDTKNPISRIIDDKYKRVKPCKIRLHPVPRHHLYPAGWISCLPSLLDISYIRSVRCLTFSPSIQFSFY